MVKRNFYCDNTFTPARLGYRPLNLRHRYIKWNLEKYGVPEEMPIGMWIVRLSWNHSRIIPGLFFGEA